MPQLRKQPSTSNSFQQVYEDAHNPKGVHSAYTQQAHEDARWKPLFRPRTVPRQKSIELEDGIAPLLAATYVERSRLHDAGYPVPSTKPLRQVAKGGLPYAQLVSHHLPTNGARLRVRNNAEDSDEGLASNTTAANPSANITFSNNGSEEPVRHGHFPEVSEYAHDDDPVSRRIQNLLRAAQRVAKTAEKRLFYPIRERDDRRKVKKYVLNVGTMQAAAIRYYQTQIVEYGAEMCKGGVYGEMPDVLHKYCDALRDMDYMQEKARNGFDHDPFLLMSTKQMEREMMLDSGLITAHEMVSGLPPAVDKGDPILPGFGRSARHHAKEARARTVNLLCAMLGGLALIVPMIIMTLVPSRTCALVTTTSFVLAFALLIALLGGLRPNEVLAVTAGYAAVLVVFVGAQSGSIGV